MTRAGVLQKIIKTIARCSHNKKIKPTRECLVQKKIDLRTQFRRIHTLKFMNLRASHPFSPIEK
jgi:hypothetical protein